MTHVEKQMIGGYTDKTQITMETEKGKSMADTCVDR